LPFKTTEVIIGSAKKTPLARAGVIAMSFRNTILAIIIASLDPPLPGRGLQGSEPVRRYEAEMRLNLKDVN
jgi:hypothetical protein